MSDANVSLAGFVSCIILLLLLFFEQNKKYYFTRMSHFMRLLLYIFSKMLRSLWGEHVVAIHIHTYIIYISFYIQ